METVDLDALHMVVGGDALAREPSGRVVFVSGAIAGERVRAELHVAKKDFARAAVIDVLVASPDRVEPACEAWHRGCGGCDWQHIAPGAQMRHKIAVVTEALTRTAKVADPVVVDGGSVPAWGYRTTVRLARSTAGYGFRSRHSHAVVPIAHCPVAADGVNAQLDSLVDTKPSHGADDLTIRTSIATGEANVAIAAGVQTAGAQAAAVEETVAGQTLRVSIGSFFQSSPAAAELLVAAVSRAIIGIDLTSARVVDAYGGIGLFAATVARDAADVVVVESSDSACRDAAVNLSDRPTRGLSAARIEPMRVEDWPPVAADVVIADPARVGLGRDAVAVLAATGATRIVLVSCDTGSMARDARLLGEAGYRHAGTEVIDAFPNTSHIESVTGFDRAVPG